jgi:hypothetical protein
MISRDHKMGLKAKPLFGTATVATDTGLIKVRAYIYISAFNSYSSFKTSN